MLGALSDEARVHLDMQTPQRPHKPCFFCVDAGTRRRCHACTRYHRNSRQRCRRLCSATDALRTQHRTGAREDMARTCACVHRASAFCSGLSACAYWMHTDRPFLHMLPTDTPRRWLTHNCCSACTRAGPRPGSEAPEHTKQPSSCRQHWTCTDTRGEKIQVRSASH